jgi:hypothetical protein
MRLYCDWAVIERAGDGTEQVHHRRRIAANVTLPWVGLRLRSAG